MGLFGFGKKEAAPSGPVGEVTLSDGQTYTISVLVDCLGDNCPRPQLMTKKAVGNAATNEVIEVKVDNPSSMEALPPMMPGLGATHLETVKGDHCWEVYIRKD